MIIFKDKKDDLFSSIKNFFSFKKKFNKLGVAVSGGLDSMVLLHLLMKIFKKKIEVLHCNFKLRSKDSDQDENFVKNFCKKKNLIFRVKKFDTLKFAKENKISIQMSARKLRYQWFNELLKTNNINYEYIGLGHHLNDSIETFFINILRGTGIKGLLGIPKKNNKFIRPLHSFNKEKIMNYAIKNNIQWINDISNNQTDKYLRNKVRINLLYPILKYFSNSFYKGIKKTMNFLQEENFLINNEIKKISKKITISKKLNPFIWKISKKEIMNLFPLHIYLFKIFFPYGLSDIKSLIQLLNSQSGKQIIAKEYRILNDRENWLLVSNNFFLKNNNKSFLIQKLKFLNQISSSIKFQCSFIKFNPSKKKFHYQNMKKIFFLDFDKIKFPLLFRTWKKGDFFYPLKMNGIQKISKYYKDHKFSLLKKEHTWILINGNNKIILIVNYCLDDRFKITENTKKILMINFL